MAVPLPQAIADACLLVQWGLRLLRRIFRPGYAYQKASGMLADIRLYRDCQGDLFAEQAPSNRRSKLMETLDAINNRWGRGHMRVGAEGVHKAGR